MLRWLGRNGAALVLALGLTLALGGCGDDNWREPSASPPPSDGGGTPPPASNEGPIAIELAGDPTITWDPTEGITAVVVQFIARGTDGVPLDSSQVDVEMLVNGDRLDNESVLRETSEELAASVHYSLVLDASGSMLQHEPEAFGPMKDAARRSVQDGVNLWVDRPGSFSWDLCWFNDVLYHRQGPWTPADISSIPDPSLNARTKLYAAIQFMAGEMADAYGADTAAGSRDQHILVIFSDGRDNYSNFDNSAIISPTTAATPPPASAQYSRFGWPATTLEDTLEAIRAHPRLTVHVLAMGSDFLPADLSNLKDIATAGGGQFLENPSSAATAQLFERVTREFTTLQTRGAAIPQQSGDYTFTLRVQGISFSGVGEQTFRYRAGPEAQLLP